MSTRPRQSKRAWLIALLPVLFLLGLWLGGHPSSLPGFLRGAFVANHDTLVVNEAISDVNRDYYRSIPRGSLSDASIGGLVASLHDRFSAYLNPKEFKSFDKAGTFSGVGIEVQPQHDGLLITRVFDNSPAAHVGLADGDEVVAVDGRRLVGLNKDEMSSLIKGRPGTDVHLTYRRHGHESTVTATRALISEPVVASQTMTISGRKLGVVALSQFTSGAHADVGSAVSRQVGQGARGILLDLRDNGGGLVEEARLISSIFIPQGVIVTTRGRSQPSMTLMATGDAKAPKVPLVVLVDANTASAAEIVTGALQDHRRAVVVGTHTFGKGVFQEVRPLSNGGALDITVGEYFTPNGRNLGGGGVAQGAGITPDIKLPAGEVDTAKGLQDALRVLAGRVR